MTLHILPELEQGSPEWHDQRRGIVTASVVGKLISVGPPSAVSVACPTCNARPEHPCVSVARKTPTAIKSLHESRIVHAASTVASIVLARRVDSKAALALAPTAAWLGYALPVSGWIAARNADPFLHQSALR